MRKTVKRSSRKPGLERLEDRTLPSTAPNVINLSGLGVNTSSYASSNILVQFRNSTNPPLALLAGTTIGQNLGLVPGLYEVNLAPQVTAAQALAVYKASASVLDAEPDYSIDSQSAVNTPNVSNNANFSQQWALNNTGQTGGRPGADIGAENAWTVTTGSPTVTVAVMDTGIDYNNTDLYNNIWINQAEIPNVPFSPDSGLTGSRLHSFIGLYTPNQLTFADLNSPINQGLGKVTDVNGDGRIDAADLLAPMVTEVINGRLYDTGQGGWAYAGNMQDGDTAHPNDFVGWNFVNNTNDPYDDNNHGTHIAGTIGGTGNAGGTLGVAPQVSLMPVKFISASGGGSLGAFIDGLNYSIQHGAKITNNSWSGAANSQILIDAINNARNAGQIFVAAAGNGGANNDVNPVYPSSFNIDNIVSVAASDSNDQLAGFSNYGAKTVSLAAPGVGILSTLPGGNYGTWDGTSMAAPMATGVLALVWAEHPTWTYQQVITQVESTVDVLPAFKGRVASNGRLDAARAVGYQQPPPAVIIPGPQVLSSVWSGPTPFAASAVRVTFNKAIDASTLTAAAVTLIGPNGLVIPSTVQVVPNSNGSQFDVTFAAQTAAGTYTIAFSSAALGVDGTALQSYQTTFAIPGVTQFTASTWVVVPKSNKASSTINVNQILSIGQVQVQLNLSDSFDGDFYIHLISPQGTDILLSNRRGAWGHNFSNTLFSDGASATIRAGNAPFNGSFRPDAPLATLIGQNANGAWQLVVENRGNHTVGVITSWSLLITGAPDASTTAQTQSLATKSAASFLPVVPQEAIPSTIALQTTSRTSSVPATDLWQGLNAGGWQALPPYSCVPVSAPSGDYEVADRLFAEVESVNAIQSAAWLARLSGAASDTENGTEDAPEEVRSKT